MKHVGFSILLTASLLVCPLRCSLQTVAEFATINCDGCCESQRDVSPPTGTEDVDICGSCVCHGAVNEGGEDDLDVDGRLCFVFSAGISQMPICGVTPGERSLCVRAGQPVGRVARLANQSLLL